MQNNTPENDGISNDERRGLNEDAHFENAKNRYENDKPTKRADESDKVSTEKDEAGNNVIKENP